jgi:two-component system, OmpR family, sensor histidine kinase CiaH
MFSPVERKLAILNVSVVVAIVALIGIGTWTLLRQSLDEEANTSLETRIEAARDTLDDLPSMSPGNQGPNTDAGQGQERRSPRNDDADDEDDEHEDEDDENDDDDEREEESREIVISGDTLLFIFDEDGRLVTNRRNVVLNTIPDEGGVAAALAGEVDTRFVTVDSERIRVRTEPVFYRGEVVGAIQAVRTETEHDDELALVRTMTLIGTGVGVLVAVPAGIYLTRRAMTPIYDVLQRQRAFVSDASHELRTPLTVLRANAEVLTRTPEISREELQRELQAMIGDIDGMAHLVDELLQLSRVDNPDYAVSIEEMALQPEIDRAVEMLAPQAARAQVALSASGEPLRVRSNAGMTGQVLRILIDNAIKYSLPGGTVTITTRRSGEEAAIEVRDTGIGIRPEDLPYVFDRFYRADRARTRSTGSGLGLPIARGIVTMLGGSIALDSVADTGTTVRVRLPLAKSGQRQGAKSPRNGGNAV